MHPGCHCFTAVPERGRTPLGAPGEHWAGEVTPVPRKCSSDNHQYTFSSSGHWSRFYTYLLIKSLQFFYNWGNRNSGRLGCFLKVTQLVGDKAGIQIQTNSCALSFPLQYSLSFNHFTHENVKINSNLPPRVYRAFPYMHVYEYACVYIHVCICVCRWRRERAEGGRKHHQAAGLL